jgi:hypothetical protein
VAEAAAAIRTLSCLACLRMPVDSMRNSHDHQHAEPFCLRVLMLGVLLTLS